MFKPGLNAVHTPRVEIRTALSLLVAYKASGLVTHCLHPYYPSKTPSLLVDTKWQGNLTT
jgi:hypothetical protein